MPKSSLERIPLVPAHRLAETAPARWAHPTLAGRLVELSGAGAAATLTLAFTLVLDAQRQEEPVAWITGPESTFFPPDAAESGVDLDALVVVRAARFRQELRAADHLVRSGAFGLVVLDLGERAQLSLPTQTRLAGLAASHHTLILCLTRKRAEAPSLGSLISLRGEGRRERRGEDQFSCHLKVLKDKRRGPGWEHTELCRGPDGLH